MIDSNYALFSFKEITFLLNCVCVNVLISEVSIMFQCVSNAEASLLCRPFQRA